MRTTFPRMNRSAELSCRRGPETPTKPMTPGASGVTKGTAISNESQIRAAGRERKEAESSEGVSGGAGLRGAAGTSGYADPAPTKSMSKQKAERFDSSQGEPTPAAVEKMTDPRALKVEDGITPTTPAPTFLPTEFDFVRSLTEAQADAEGYWVRVNESSEVVATDEPALPSTSLAEKKSEANAKDSQPDARFSYRFRRAEVERVPNAPIDLSLRTDVKKTKEVSEPVFIELQVPVEEWDAGAKRLKQMGMDVPLELPDAEYLDFTGNQSTKEASGMADTEKNFSFRELDTDTKMTDATPNFSWQFRRSEFRRNPFASKPDSNKANANSENGREQMEPGDKIQIRVRVIRKQ